jgi:hypothetical protein
MVNRESIMVLRGRPLQMGRIPGLLLFRDTRRISSVDFYHNSYGTMSRDGADLNANAPNAEPHLAYNGVYWY